MRHAAYSFGRATALVLLLLLGACAGTSDYMREVAPEKVNYTVEPDKALLVFMRPSGLGFAVQSSVFDITDGNPEFIGIVSAKKKIAYYSPPGERKFMVIGESADFMGATLDPKKVYYALVTPRMGMWKARFSLRAVQGASVNTAEFAEWYNDTQWVENLDSAKAWAAQNMSSIREKKNEYLVDWEQKPNKPMLQATDGQAGLYQATAAK